VKISEAMVGRLGTKVNRNAALCSVLCFVFGSFNSSVGRSGAAGLCSAGKSAEDRTLDRRNLAMLLKLGLEPSVYLPGTALNGLLTGAAGQINGTTPEGHNVDRVGVGTGVYSLGAPRQIEFGLRLTF
jgi:hypothetical protein